MKQPIRQSYQLNIQALSPVHIGNGKKYVHNFDYVQEGNKVHVFDQASLFAQVESLGENAISSFTVALENQELAGFIKERKIDPKSVSLFSFPWDPRFSLPADIRRFIRDGLGRPIIPGSSLKGVFRTAILSRLVEEQGNGVVAKHLKSIATSKGKSTNPKYASNPISESMLGKDAKYNLMRSLIVSDCALPASALQVDNAFVSRLVAGGHLFKRKHWSMLIERVRPGESAAGQISFDCYLQDQAREKTEFNFRAPLTLDWLLEALRRRTQRFLAAELAFLDDKSGDGVQELKHFYKKIQNDTERLGPMEAIVQFAWGSGWKGMTGELLQPDQLTQGLRSALQLAKKYLDFPFPKSRRLAGKGGGCQPIGWVKLSFKEKGEDTRPVPNKLVDSSQLSLKRIEAVQTWDALKKTVASDLSSENNSVRTDLAEAFKTAALRVKDNHPKTWSDERDQQMIQWLTPFGLEWETCSEQQEESSDSPNEVLAAGFTTYGDWLQCKLKLEQLNLVEAESLLKLFKEWKLDNKKAWKKKPEKKEQWDRLQGHLKQLRSKA